MVDEEGFSPIEMARLMSDKVGVDSSATRMLGEPLAAKITKSNQPILEESRHRPTSILKSQNSSALGVTFDIQNISDDEADDNIDPFVNHGIRAQDNAGVVASSARFDRPSTSNFFENRSELNSGRISLMDSVEGSLNLDTHTNDEVMRKMYNR
jgi:hypothetical protein